MALLRTKWDKVFSDYIRERDNWTCQRCGVKYNKHSPTRRSLHCSHYFGRASWRTRLEPANAMSLCYGCHRYVASHPDKHHDLWMKRFTNEEIASVMKKRNSLSIKKRDVANEETYIKLRGMLKELQEDG